MIKHAVALVIPYARYTLRPPLAFERATIWVPEGEDDRYRAAGFSWVDSIPSEFTNRAQALNFVLGHYQDQGYESLVLLGPELLGVGWVEMLGTRLRQWPLDEQAKAFEFARLTSVCQRLGRSAWTLADGDYQWGLRPAQPFASAGYAPSFITGFADLNLRYNPDFTELEDYDLSLRLIDASQLLYVRYLFWIGREARPVGSARREAEAKRITEEYAPLIRRSKEHKGLTELTLEFPF